jgi:ParB family chromosome partitioning protein
MMRLLKLPQKIQNALMEGKLTMGHARALLSVAGEREQIHLFERFLADGNVTVRSAEAMTRRHKKPSRNGDNDADFFPENQKEAKILARVEEQLRRQLATQVKIRPKGKGGVVEITYYSPDDLSRLLELVER